MTVDPDLAAARARAEAARLRLLRSTEEAKAALSPKRLAADAADRAKARAIDAARDGLAAASHRPGLLSAAVVAIGLAVLRKPIAGLFRRRRGKRATGAKSKS